MDFLLVYIVGGVVSLGIALSTWDESDRLTIPQFLLAMFVISIFSWAGVIATIIDLVREKEAK